MSLTRFDISALLTELIAHTLTFLTEQEVLWFAQTSKENTTIAHRALLTRGMSHLPWRKLLAAATMQPDLIPLTDTLVLQQNHRPCDNIFDEAARALFLLARNNRQIVVSDQWIDSLLIFYRCKAHDIEVASGNMLSVLIPIMTDTQFEKVFAALLKQITQHSTQSNRYLVLGDHTINLLQLMSLRLSPKQLTDLAQKENTLDMMDIIVSADHTALVFNNIIYPFLTAPLSDPRLNYTYEYLFGFGERPAMLLKLYPHLSEAYKSLAMMHIRSALRHHNSAVAKSAYQLMQSLEPAALIEEVQAGVEKLKGHLLTRKTGIPIEADWKKVLEPFGAMSPSLTTQHLDDILPLMVDLFTAWSGTHHDKYHFDQYGLALFAEIASSMSGTQACTVLTVVEKLLRTQAFSLFAEVNALLARTQLLKRVGVDKRKLALGPALTMYQQYTLAGDPEHAIHTINIIIELAQDMSETEAESIFPKLQSQLLELQRNDDLDPSGTIKDTIKEAFTALIPRLSKDGVLRWITAWKDIPWLLLRCLYLRTQELEDDLLMGFMPELIKCLNRPDATSGEMAQAIIISFTSRPNVTLPESMLLLIQNILNVIIYQTVAYNVWCHLMMLGKYDLRQLASLHHDNHPGLFPLIHLIEAASNEAPQASSVSVVSSGHSFFRIIPRQPQPSPPAPSIATPQ